MTRGATRLGFYFGKEGTSLQERRVQARIPAGIETKKQLLDALDASLGFPEYFGGNWDALWDCICDLSWLEPVQIVLLHEDLPMQSDDASRAKYLAILRDAVAVWSKKPEHDLVVVFPEEVEGMIGDLMAGA